MLKQIKGKWVLVSRKTQRPLAYYRGEGKPSEEWVRKQEARIQAFKQMNEAAYMGNLGIHELINFHSKANEQQKKQLQQHIKDKNHQKFKELIKDVTGVKLHDIVKEDFFNLDKAASPILHPFRYRKAADDLRKVLDKKRGEKRHDKLYYASVVAQQHPHVDPKKLLKHVGEEVKPDILPKAGAGQDGTEELVKTYMKDTPGQSLKKFKDYIK
jgi:hypothetical protein